MLLYLERGLALYGIGITVFLGLCSKWLANHTYNRLLLQTEDGLSVKNECLRQLKHQYESISRKCGDVHNLPVLVEKQMGQLRVLGIRLYRMENLIFFFALLSFLIGTCSSLTAFLLQGTIAMIAEYLVVGIAGGILLVAAESLCDTAAKRRLLFIQMMNYLDNILYAQMKTAPQEEAEEKTERKTMKDDTFVSAKRETENSTEAKADSGRRKTMADVLQEEEERRQAAREETSAKGDYLSREREQDIAFLKKSLEQIAASKEQEHAGSPKKLSPEEERLMEEIISEYFRK